MRRFLILALSVAALVAASVDVSARPIRIGEFQQPLTNRVLQSDLVVVGKVQAISEKPERVKVNGTEIEYTIATIKVETTLCGPEGDTHVRVAFIKGAGVPNINAPTDGPAIAPAIPIGQNALPPNGKRYIAPNTLTVTKDQEGVFFLTKLPETSLYTLAMASPPIESKAADYKKQVAEIETLAKILKNPKTALQSKDSSERMRAVQLVLQQLMTVKNPSGRPLKRVPIKDKELSKLVLTALLEAEWPAFDPNRPYNPLQPNILFWQLGVSPEEGWKNPQPQIKPGEKFDAVKHQAVIMEAQKEWLKANRDTFQLKTIEEDKNAPAVPGPIGRPGFGGVLPGNAPALPPIKAVPLPIQIGPGNALPIKVVPQPLPAPVRDVEAPAPK